MLRVVRRHEVVRELVGDAKVHRDEGRGVEAPRGGMRRSGSMTAGGPGRWKGVDSPSHGPPEMPVRPRVRRRHPPAVVRADMAVRRARRERRNPLSTVGLTGELGPWHRGHGSRRIGLRCPDTGQLPFLLPVRVGVTPEDTMRGILLWLLGIPIPIITLLYLFNVL